MRGIIFLLLFVAGVTARTQAQNITHFILVRHAEKATSDKDTELSEAGKERALRLAELLKNSKISAVYSTKYKRTRNTVAPLAQERNLSITDYETMTGELLEKIAAENRGGTVVIAGHSNTVPVIANTLLGTSEFQNFPDTEYGIILVISVVEVAKVASVLRLNY
ncbi:MAG TPA: phosphoglycerate mutase family protein [Chryseosolibacter sp.]